MALSTILAEGTTAATSTDVVIAAGVTVTIGMFSATRLLPESVATILIATPGVNNPLGQLNASNQQRQVVGPATVRVFRPQGPTLGIFLDA